MTNPLFLFIGAVAVAAGSSWLTDRVRRFGLIDHPNERSSHAVPTPRGGGIAISLLTLAAFLALSALTNAAPARAIVGYAVAGALISAISLLDDIRTLGIVPRLGTQFLVAGIAATTCGYPTEIRTAAGTMIVGTIGLAFAVLWTVALTNVYNFMDGIDGIAGIQAVSAALGWTILGVLENEPVVTILGAGIAASTLGFLRHNWSPARIFMGDVGSAFLGFSFAVLPMLSSRPSEFAIPALIFVWPFVFDGTLTLIRRAFRGENLFKAHRSHLYQRLNIAGYPHGWISILYGLLALEGAAAAIAFVRGSLTVQAAVSAVLLVTGLLLWGFVLRVERSRSPARGL